MSEKLPRNALRLFAHYEDAEQLSTGSPGLVMARLLEEGDASDLQWLTRTYPESRLASWLDQYGARQLSRRSLSFWRTVLNRSDGPRKGPGDPLWPL
jgi:hypothetical protein